MRAIVLFMVSLLLVSCQSNPESADAVEQDVSEPDVVESSTLTRPDPNVPSGENNAVPEDWVVRLDRPSEEVTIGADAESADIFFVNMTPGWHITSGPSAIYYHPASTASGTYTAKAGIHLFDPGERTEAFGLFVGGANLDADDQVYDYFLIRNSGEYLIKRRTGNDTELIQDWTSHEAIVRYTAESEASVLNELTVNVRENEVGFGINGEEVAAVPVSEIRTDGMVGLRVNHALNLHVSNLEVVN
ncbi:MAG: hypothetical protein KTR29_20415 [Rhodothermaceae bacterium]|nr:hypothetical protein [Rhodothermaceae bacterium]